MPDIIATKNLSTSPSLPSPGSVRTFIRQHRLAAFFFLAYLLSWYPWLLALTRGQTTGPNPLGPFAAALIVTALAEGWPGVRSFLGRLVRGRLGPRWYAIVFGLPVLICALSAIATSWGLIGHVTLPATSAWRELPDRFIFILLFIGLGEEPGWRGFALPHLQKKHSPLIASLILAPVWALWHLPLMGSEFPLPIIPAFLVSILGGTLVQTWLFNRTKESVLVQMLFHATVNTIGAGLIFPLFTGVSLIALWWIYSILWLLAGFALILVPRPARRQETKSFSSA
jgi:membrane protease YdiL (CAAX protease family)